MRAIATGWWRAKGMMRSAREYLKQSDGRVFALKFFCAVDQMAVVTRGARG
ncbi:hypothetical protein SKA53_14636 [Yoonia vestfoldensis SKA53]|uniref:Uncharacterized protein n=1 Tax=Yoonia vestfoldensis SKA53 TaxID=314232 RepID=A3V575_9RHOB|nr:hypothetical protein SKA53_14636 [Yoonia vestfoldensis SKA53]